MGKSRALLGLAALGIGLALFTSQKPKEPERKGVTEPPLEPPPLTLSPKGRHLTAFERFVMERYFNQQTLNAARLWFGRPPSALSQETDKEEGVTTESVTKGPDIYFRFENHEISKPDELALLAHELVHVEQNVTGIRSSDSSENEVRAYQMQISVKADTDRVLDDLKSRWQGARYA